MSSAIAREPLRFPRVVAPSSAARSGSSTAHAQNPAEQRKASMINRIWKPLSDMAGSVDRDDMGPKWIRPSKIRQEKQAGDEDHRENEEFIDQPPLALQVHEHQHHA